MKLYQCCRAEDRCRKGDGCNFSVPHARTFWPASALWCTEWIVCPFLGWAMRLKVRCTFVKDFES